MKKLWHLIAQDILLLTMGAAASFLIVWVVVSVAATPSHPLH